MLVLTRKIGEAIQIGDQISIEVLEVRGGRVRLGITAPRDIGVNRSEVLTFDEPALAVGCTSAPFGAVQPNSFMVSGS